MCHQDGEDDVGRCENIDEASEITPEELDNDNRNTFNGAYLGKVLN